MVLKRLLSTLKACFLKDGNKDEPVPPTTERLLRIVRVKQTGEMVEKILASANPKARKTSDNKQDQKTTRKKLEAIQIFQCPYCTVAEKPTNPRTVWPRNWAASLKNVSRRDTSIKSTVTEPKLVMLFK